MHGREVKLWPGIHFHNHFNILLITFTNINLSPLVFTMVDAIVSPLVEQLISFVAKEIKQQVIEVTPPIL